MSVQLAQRLARRRFLAQVGAAATAFAVPHLWIKPAEADYIYQPWRQYPFTCIGRVFVNWNMRNATCGTGVMVGKRLVLTCAHILYNEIPEKRGSFPPSLSFTPAYNNRGRMRSFNVLLGNFYDGWLDEARKSRSDQNYRKIITTDLAILILRQSPGVGSLGLDSDEKDYPRSVQHVGYPDIGNGDMWHHEVEINIENDMIYAGAMRHEIYKGMSGSPFFYRNNEGKHFVCGIHSHGGPNGSQHAKVTDDLLALVRHLDQEYPG